MYYVVEGHEAATREGLVNTVRRAFERIDRCNPDGFGEWMEVVPFTEKGRASVRYKKFTIHVNIRGGNKTIFIYGDDSLSYKVYDYIRLYATYFNDINASVYYIG